MMAPELAVFLFRETSSVTPRSMLILYLHPGSTANVLRTDAHPKVMLEGIWELASMGESTRTYVRTSLAGSKYSNYLGTLLKREKLGTDRHIYRKSTEPKVLYGLIYTT